MKKKSILELNRLDASAFQNSPKRSIILFADQIRSGHNIGSLFRIADAFLLEAVYLSSYCVKPPHPEIEKSAIGSTETVKWLSIENSIECLHSLKALDYRLVGIEQTHESCRLENYPVSHSQKYVLIFGNEITGISQPILDLLDDCIEIPQYGTKHSLNVSVAVGIVVWHFLALK